MERDNPGERKHFPPTLENRVNYLRNHSDIPNLLTHYKSTFAREDSTFYTDLKLAKSNENVVTVPRSSHMKGKFGLIRQCMIKAYETAAAKDESLTLVELHGRTTELVHRTDPDKEVAYETVTRYARRQGYPLVQASKVRNVLDPTTNKRRKITARTCVREIEEAERNDTDVAFMDESSAQYSVVTKNTKVLRTPQGTAYNNSASTNITSRASITLYITEEEIEHYHVKQTTNKKEDFKKDLVVWLKKRRRQGKGDVLLLLDNAPIHSEDMMEEVQEDFPEFHWCRLPVYSPDTNTVEYVFHTSKSGLRKNRDHSKVYAPDEWVEFVRSEFHRLKAERCGFKGIYDHVKRLLEQLQTHNYAKAVIRSHRSYVGNR